MVEAYPNSMERGRSKAIYRSSRTQGIVDEDEFGGTIVMT